MNDPQQFHPNNYMNISTKDVSYLGIVDSTGRVYYDMNYDKVDTKDLLNDLSNSPISIYKDKTLLNITKYSQDIPSIRILLLCRKDSNELFVNNAFENFVGALEKHVKTWTVGRIESKFDLIVLLANEFVFNGIILEDVQEKLLNKIQKRTFESVSGIKVNKGFATVLNKTAKSMKSGFHK